MTGVNGQKIMIYIIFPYRLLCSLVLLVSWLELLEGGS